MLALTRRIGEEIVIGDPSNPLGVIRVVAVHGDKVRLSFDFPKDVKINRKELAELKAKGPGGGGTGGGNGEGGANGGGVGGNGAGPGQQG
ncbi:MAG: carbon storage regulator [Phycisphaeraceae bacterium]